ncbi:axonemal dynein light intermediate polypeptide 1 [Pyrgilauda ruficollis]|uniref:axonemal dynein light intermediate polypeptide 1 n=1 Tax=Pyrgilauda ruficollis TaxID=221976 RepID=UPI001B875500|nr:axonemal dynein light intermediate polypeptide 1 [Pyrgilauda ruficollis]
MAAPPESLLRYCPPVLVSRRGDRPSAGAQAPRSPASFSSTPQPQELLNAILPPREWEEAQKLWVQEVSTAPSTRRDVVQLQEQLDRQLQQRQARETGLCPVRRELYTQCFVCDSMCDSMSDSMCDSVSDSVCDSIAELEEEKEALEKQVSEEKAKCEAIERQETERREIEEKKHSEEVLFLKRTNQQLKS